MNSGINIKNTNEFTRVKIQDSENNSLFLIIDNDGDAHISTEPFGPGCRFCTSIGGDTRPIASIIRKKVKEIIKAAESDDYSDDSPGQQLQWTFFPPTTPGYYWVRNIYASGKTEPKSKWRIWRVNKNLEVRGLGVPHHSVQWAGPIPEPTEAK